MTSPQTSQKIKVPQYPAHLFEPLKNTQENKPIDCNPNTARAGTIIHKLLELLSEFPDLSNQALLNRIHLECKLECSLEEFHAWKEEALHCLQDIAIKKIFELDVNQHAYTEVSIASPYEKQKINVIDRLLINKESAWIIDFKTQSDISPETANTQVKKHQPQLERYIAAVQSLYPKLEIRCFVLFTKIPLLVEWRMALWGHNT